MAYAYVQKTFSFSTSSPHVLTWAQPTGAGNLLVLFFAKAVAGSEFAGSLAGNVNTSQTWVSAVGAIGNINSNIATGSANANLGTASLLFLPGANNLGGDATTSLTITNDTGGNTTIGAMEFSGIASTLPFINYSLNAQTAPGTGANVTTSNAVTIGTVPALLAGFLSNDTAMTAVTGTGFSGRGLDATTGAFIWGEDKRVTSGGSTPATFTDSNASGDHTLSIGMAFAEPGIVAIPSRGPMPKQIYIMP